MLRREVIKMSGGLFGLGRPSPSRFPYPGRPQPSPGVAPSQGAVVRANTVIVFGPSGTPVGVFVYQPGTTPALGNPPIASMTAATTDPFGNAVKPDITVYGTGGNTTFVQMQAGSPAALSVGTGDAAEARPGRVIGVILGSGATRQVVTQLEAAKLTGEASLVNAGVQILSPSVDLTTDPVSVALFAQDAVPNVAALSVFPTLIQAAGPFSATGKVTATGGTPASPTLVTTDTVQAAALLNGWGGSLSYYLTTENEVRVYGSLVTPNPAPAGTSVVFNVPAAYQPAATGNDGVLETATGGVHNAAFDVTFRIAAVPVFVAGHTIVVNSTFHL